MTKTNFRRGFKKECDDKSLFYRKELGLTHQEWMSAKDLANHLGIILLTPALINQLPHNDLSLLTGSRRSQWSGAMFQCDDKNVIIYNDKHAPVRQESTIMHEIAHFICGHHEELSKNSLDLNIRLMEYNPQHEAEAEWLGACLQLPREGLYWARKAGMDDKAIGLRFNASLQMTKYRIRMTGVDSQLSRARKFVPKS